MTACGKTKLLMKFEQSSFSSDDNLHIFLCKKSNLALPTKFLKISTNFSRQDHQEVPA